MINHFFVMIWQGNHIQARRANLYVCNLNLGVRNDWKFWQIVAPGLLTCLYCISWCIVSLKSFLRFFSLFLFLQTSLSPLDKSKMIISKFAIDENLFDYNLILNSYTEMTLLFINRNVIFQNSLSPLQPILWGGHVRVGAGV